MRINNTLEFGDKTIELTDELETKLMNLATEFSTDSSDSKRFTFTVDNLYALLNAMRKEV